MDEYSEGITGLCACIGSVGKDPYCPCRMKAMNLHGDFEKEWSDKKRKELGQALKKIIRRKNNGRRQ